MKPKKHLGQNFLTNPGTLEKIVKAANLSHSDAVVEVGPGKGILTRELVKLAKKVTTIEKDSDLIPILKEKFKDIKNLEIIEADVLKTKPSKEPYKVVANIPYYITSPILNHFLQDENPPASMTLLVQKEVAEKICAKEGRHSTLSLQVRLFGTPQIIATVPASHFNPAPKVDSAILHIRVRKKNPIPPDEARKILRLAKQAFSGKRKKLSNTLRHLIPLLEKLGLRDARPQHLKIQDWQNLLS